MRKSGFDHGRFIALRPYAYHLTAGRNLSSITSTRRIMCAAEIISTGRPDLRCERRLRSEVVAYGSGQIEIRDQIPLHAGAIEFEDATPAEVIQHINQHVFFWPGDEISPIDSGKHHFTRYASEKPAVIRVKTELLFDANSSQPLFCKYNSGAPRCSAGRKSPRGRSMYTTAQVFPGTAGEVTELLFRDFVVLPDQTEVSDRLCGPWKPL